MCKCGNLRKIQSLLYGDIGLMKLLFLKAFQQMFFKERIDRTTNYILVKTNYNYSGKTFSHYGSWSDTSYLKISNMYKNTLASKCSIFYWSIPQLYPSTRTKSTRSWLPEKIKLGVFIFTRLLKKRTSRNMWSSWNHFGNNNGQRIYKGWNRERCKKIRWSNS